MPNINFAISQLTSIMGTERIQANYASTHGGQTLLPDRNGNIVIGQSPPDRRASPLLAASGPRPAASAAAPAVPQSASVAWQGKPGFAALQRPLAPVVTPPLTLGQQRRAASRQHHVPQATQQADYEQFTKEGWGFDGTKVVGHTFNDDGHDLVAGRFKDTFDRSGKLISSRSDDVGP